MEFENDVRKVGGSLGVLIPHNIVKKYKLVEKDIINVEIKVVEKHGEPSSE